MTHDTPDRMVLPLSPHAFWVLVTLLGLCALSFVIWLTLQQGKEIAQPRSWVLRAVNGFGMLLVPVWLGLLLFVLWLLVRLATTMPAITAGDQLRWHVLALVGLLTALGGLIATPLALIKLHTTERQTKTAEDGLITDRLNAAVANLGAVLADGGPNMPEPNMPVRIGGLYALERLARDQPPLHVQIMEILCTYIRHNAPAGGAVESDSKKKSYPLTQRIDIQTAIDILGHRSPAQIEIERAQKGPGNDGHYRGYFLDLHKTNLQKIMFKYINLEHAKLYGAALDMADLSGATGLTQDQINTASSNSSTKLPDGLQRHADWLDE